MTCRISDLKKSNQIEYERYVHMFVIPFQVSETEYSVFVGIDDEGLSRMKEYDPAELVLSKLPLEKLHLQDLKLKDVLFGYCSESDAQHVMKLMTEANSSRPGLQYLTRGWKFRPEMGDHDGPPLSMRNDPEEKIN